MPLVCPWQRPVAFWASAILAVLKGATAEAAPAAAAAAKIAVGAASGGPVKQGPDDEFRILMAQVFPTPEPKNWAAGLAAGSKQADGAKLVQGMLQEVSEVEADVRKSAKCRRIGTFTRGLDCGMSRSQLHHVASLQLQAAQVMTNVGFLLPALPLFAATCTTYTTLGVYDVPAMLWDMALAIQNEGLHYLHVREFYKALHAAKDCRPHKDEAILLGAQLPGVAGAAKQRPSCGERASGVSGLRVKGGADRTWAHDLPEFCPVVDVAHSKNWAQVFLDEYVLKSQPAVLRGLPPLGKPFRPKDDLIAGLREKFGHRMVTAWASPNRSFYTSEAMRDGSGARAHAHPAEVPLPLRDLLMILTRDTEDLGAVFFGQHINLDREVPALAEELWRTVHSTELQVLGALPLRRINLWLAPMENRISNGVHWDDHDSLLYQLRCGKEFLLFPPGDRDKLAYAGHNEQVPSYQWRFNISSSLGNVQWQLASTTEKISSAAHVDLEKPDFEAFPRLKEVLPPRKCTVRSGDALYLPAFWHRDVHNIGGASAGELCGCINAAVNFWYRPLLNDTGAALVAAETIAKQKNSEL